MPDPVAIRPCEGRRVILHDGAQTLDGLAIPPGADMPAEGALVQPAIWVHRCLEDGDAEPVPQKAQQAATRANARRDADAPTPTPGIPA